jgi:hypothetical protein
VTSALVLPARAPATHRSRCSRKRLTSESRRCCYLTAACAGGCEEDESGSGFAPGPRHEFLIGQRNGACPAITSTASHVLA